MRRLGGPELKMPELKVPPFAADLYYDLRDRRLLPLVAVVLAALVAVPFLLSGDSEEPQPEAAPKPAGEAGTAGASSAETARLTVVESKPGLRDYRKRLRSRRPTDPFKQRFSGPVVRGGQLSSESATTSTSPSTETSTPTTTESFETTTKSPEPSPATSSPGSGGVGGDEPSQIALFAFAIDVKITRTETKPNGSKEREPETRKRVLAPATLPSQKKQVVTYMGISPKTKKPLFLVSSDVTAVFGEGKCVSGTETCQLLEVEPTFPETFVYGENGVRYKINVLSVEPVSAGHFRSRP